MSSRHEPQSAFMVSILSRASAGPIRLTRWETMRFMLEFPLELRFCRTSIPEPHVLLYDRPAYLSGTAPESPSEPVD